MFEVLVYLFENYFESDIRPDENTLERELNAAGFDEDDIHRAFDWFSRLDELTARTDHTPRIGDVGSMRIYADVEAKKIQGEALSFLMFVEQAGVLNTSQRELVIDRAMALPESEVSVEEMKWIVLMALWKQEKADDFLFLEDAIFSDEKPTIH